MKCEGCGFDAPAEFAFCPQCGRRFAAAPAPAPAAEADRRPATILFADLSGFTALSERLDPEDVRALQTDLFDEMRAALQPEDAFVEKFVGDAVMAVFGAPLAHEDDPQRALRAALRMHERTAALAQRWHARLGQPLQLHIGINSGRVVAGQIGSADGAAYAVTGDAVNVAARLQAAADPGTTLVSAETQALAREDFVFEDAGTVRLKGKSQRQAVCRLIRAARRSDGGVPRGTGLAPRLVGRDTEAARLQAALERAHAGVAQVVALVGEAGIGKSRLLDPFVAQVRALRGDAAVGRTHCAPQRDQPYSVVARLFGDAFGLQAQDALAAVRRKVEAALAALGASADEVALVVPMAGYLLGLNVAHETVAAEPERLQRQIDTALRIVLERRLARGALVLLVEDAQWADAASLAALATMADWLHGRPLLLLLSGRPSSAFAAFAGGRAACETLRLEPLAERHARALLASYFGDAGLDWLPAPLRERLLAQTGGNPLFLEETVRGLIAARVLMRHGGTWRCDESAAPAEVPATLEGLLLSRIDRLAPTPRRCLQAAAVLGSSFDAALLRELDAAADAAVLDALCAQGHLAHGGGGRYRFGALIAREVVYQNLLLRRRTELHGRIGRLLESRGSPDRLEDLETLGHHFSLGDDPRRGAGYLVAAADWARGLYANDDAIRLYRRAEAALALHADADAAQRLAIGEHLGDLLGLTGQRDDALAQFERLLRHWRERGEARHEARIQRKLAGLHWEAGARERSRACLDAGLALLGGGDDGGIEASHLLQEQGRFAFRTGDNDAALRWAERALAGAERCAAQAAPGSAAHRDASAAVAQALNTLGAALTRLERPAEAVPCIERGIAIAEAEGLLQAACRGYANLGVLYAGFQPARAIDTCRAGLDTARRIGDLGFQSRLYANLAVAYCALTNQCDVEGLRAAEAAIDLDRRLGQLDHLAVPLIVLAQIHQCHGDPQAALGLYLEAQQLAERIGEPQLLFPVYDGLGTLYLDLGQTDEAEAFLIKANQVCDAAGLDRDALVVLPFLC